MALCVRDGSTRTTTNSENGLGDDASAGVAIREDALATSIVMSLAAGDEDSFAPSPGRVVKVLTNGLISSSRRITSAIESGRSVAFLAIIRSKSAARATGTSGRAE